MNEAISFHSGLADDAAALLEKLRGARPRVHCITNAAAQVFTANLLLAAGGIPSLSFAAEEVRFFTRRSAALLVNLGTLDAERRSGIPLAIEAAQDARIPIVLDPVFVEASPPRLAMACNLLRHRPNVLRCNASEFSALQNADDPKRDVTQFAAASHCTIALTGPVDCVTDGARIVSIANGHKLMSQTTAMGCAGTALIAAFCAMTEDSLIAAASALLVLGIAGEQAGRAANGPGSFVPAFLDCLAALNADDISAYARIEP